MSDSTMSYSRKLKTDELIKHMLPDSGSESDYYKIKENLAKLSERQLTDMLKEAIEQRIKQISKSDNVGPKPITYPEQFRDERIKYILTAEDDLREFDGSKSRSIKEQNKRKHELEALDRVELNELYARTKVILSDAAIEKSYQKNAAKRLAAELEDRNRGSVHER